MTMRPWTAALSAVAAGALLAQTAIAATTLRVSSCLAKNHDQTEVYFSTFQNPVNAANGLVRLDYIGGPEVTPPQKQAAALKRGLVDMIVCPSSYYAGAVAEARLTGVSNLSMPELRKSGAIDMLQKAWAKDLNARIVGWGYFGGADFHIYTTFEPKLSLKTGIDLTGHKMRSTSLYKPFLDAMGAAPVSIPAGDVYTALQRGVVDGLAWPEGAVVKYGWQRFLKYRVYPGFFRSTTMIIINLDVYNALPKAAQAELDKAGIAYEAASGPALRKKADADNAKLFAGGLKKLELTGKYREAYLGTIFGANWADNAKRSYTVDFEELKSKMYRPGS